MSVVRQPDDEGCLTSASQGFTTHSSPLSQTSVGLIERRLST